MGNSKGQLNKSTLLSATLGIGIGLLPATSELVPIVLAVISLIFAAFNLRKLTEISYLPILPLLTYLLFNAAMNLFHGGLFADGNLPLIYLSQAIAAFLVFFFLQSVGLDRKVFYSFSVYSLFSSFFILAFQHYDINFTSVQCGASAFSGNSQWVSAFLIVLVSALLVIWHQERIVSGLVIAALVFTTIVSITLFTGARMSFYTFASFLVCFLGYLAHRRAFSDFKTVSISLVASITLSFFLNGMSPCNFFDRLSQQISFAPRVFSFAWPDDENQKGALVNAAPSVQSEIAPPASEPEPKAVESRDDTPAVVAPAETSETVPAIDTTAAPTRLIDASEIDAPAANPVDDYTNGGFYSPEAVALITLASGASRVAMWQNAVDNIKLSPWFGFGQFMEPKIASHKYDFLKTYTHVHNQYLSWMLWSGLFGLFAGIVLITGLLTHGKNKGVGISFLFVLGMLFLTETLLLPFNVNILIVIYIFLHHISAVK